jgi:hypothetical protein
MTAKRLSKIEFLPSGPVRERFFDNIHEHSARQGTHEEIQAMGKCMVGISSFWTY